MAIPASFENQFKPGVIKEIDMRLHDVEFACALLTKASEIRQSKASAISINSMNPEQQAAACITGHYLSGPDLFSLAHNGLKEFRARRLELTANTILQDDTY